MRYISFITLILLLSCVYTNANISEYGLYIRSHPLPVSNFTSMMLENGRPLKTKGGQLDLNFELWVRKDNVFGTVFRVITNENENIDLMYRSENNIRLPFLLIGEEVFLMQNPVREETWLDVTLSLNPKSGRIVLNYDGEEIDVIHEKLKGTKSARISFGYCPFEGFSLDDVASVNIKNVSLERDEKEIRFWKMEQHVGDVCRDEITGVPAVGKNAQWIVDDYITWRKIYEQALETTPAIAFDSIGSNFFITTESEIYTLSPLRKNRWDGIKIDTTTIQGGRYAANAPNQLIYIAPKRQLLSYNLTEDAYSIFDFTQAAWESESEPKEDHVYWNSTVVFNPSDSALISFGGYGHYLYNNKLLFCYPFHEEKQPCLVSLPEIDPRYSPASALVGENLYIFGGRGSPTGRQELSPRNYYDLYSVNLTDKSVNQRWSLPESPENGDFIPSENMIYDGDNQCFYVFTSQSGGVLMKIDAENPEFVPVSLPLGIRFNTHYIYTDLFFTPRYRKLYASVLLSHVGGESTLEIYEMDYPPVSVHSLQQDQLGMGQMSFPEKWYWLLGIVFLVAMVTIIVYYYRKKPKKKVEVVAPQDVTVALPHSAFDEEGVPRQYYNFTQGCICFLGRFRAFDKKGKDITSLFSPTLTSLLIALVCYSVKDSRGISGHKLIQLLWYDKSDEAAKNNRNVYMSKLRTILEEIGDLKIINQNSYWRIQIEDNTLCDYLEIMRLFEEKGNHDLEKMLELLTRGAMLPNVEIDWVDTFKNDFANTAIDFLCRILKKFDLTDSLKLKIADTLFQYDFLSEEALQIKCSILYQQSKIGLAKTIYDTFCNLHKTSLGTDYQYSFMQVVECC